MLKRMSAAVLAMVLTFSMGLTVFAETGGAGNNTPGGAVGTQGGMTGNTVTTAADNDTDWGWIGLLGLAGLAGLMGRNRNENPNRG